MNTYMIVIFASVLAIGDATGSKPIMRRKKAVMMPEDGALPVDKQIYRSSLGSSEKLLAPTMVTLSFHMSGHLNATLACNAKHVDRIIVITTKDDTATLSLCGDAGQSPVKDQSKITCHVTDALHKYGATFNKGRALNEVQKLLQQDPNMIGKAMLLMDPDICLPEDIWQQFPAEPEDLTLYSVTRRCLYATPQAALNGVPDGIEMADKKGYKSMGFFGLYKITPLAPNYPTEYGTAAQSDLAFGMKFKTIVRFRGYAHHFGRNGKWKGEATQSDKWSQVRIPSRTRCPKASEDTGKTSMGQEIWYQDDKATQSPWDFPWKALGSFIETSG